MVTGNWLRYGNRNRTSTGYRVTPNLASNAKGSAAPSRAKGSGTCCINWRVVRCSVPPARIGTVRRVSLPHHTATPCSYQQHAPVLSLKCRGSQPIRPQGIHDRRIVTCGIARHGHPCMIHGKPALAAVPPRRRRAGGTAGQARAHARWRQTFVHARTGSGLETQAWARGGTGVSKDAAGARCGSGEEGAWRGGQGRGERDPALRQAREIPARAPSYRGGAPRALSLHPSLTYELTGSRNPPRSVRPQRTL